MYAHRAKCTQRQSRQTCCMPCSTLVLLVYRKCTKVDCRYNTHQCRAHTGAWWGHVVNMEPEAASSYWVTVVLTRPTKWSQLKRRGGCFCLPSSCRLRLSDPPQPNDISSPVSSAAARPRFPHWPKALCVNGQMHGFIDLQDRYFTPTLSKLCICKTIFWECLEKPKRLFVVSLLPLYSC